MKRVFTQVFLLIPFLIFLQLYISAQPKYTFKNPTKISGTSLHVNAIYKFANVAAGLDARVTIKAITGTITLTAIDDNSTGFDEAFQPFINVPVSSSGYVEFQVDFVLTGTAIPVVQSSIPITCIDVDGSTYNDGVLYEEDQVQYFPGYYDFSMTGSNISVLNPPGWITIRNTSGVSYPGIDTSAKDVMATVVNANVSGFKIRIGASNTSPTNTEVRYRSVYFKTFNYSNASLLPNRTLLSFSGADKTNGIQLNGNLSGGHTYNKIVIERGSNSSYLMPIAELPITNGGVAEFPFTYFDESPENGANFYRIRLVNTVHQIQEISNVLMVKRNGSDKGLQLYNTIVQASNPVLTITAGKNEEAMLLVSDLAGRVLYKNNVNLYPGSNNISLGAFHTGTTYAVAVIEAGTERKSTKIIIQ